MTVSDKERRRVHPTNYPSGFTIVEIVVTLVVLSIFVYGFFQTYMVIESQRIDVARQADASDIAYSNLRKVPSRPALLTQQVCTANASIMDLTTGNPSTKTGLDITQYGYKLEPDADAKKVLGPVETQSLVAFAPEGCTDPNFSLKIVSTVTYGTTGDKVSHARYIN